MVILANTSHKQGKFVNAFKLFIVSLKPTLDGGDEDSMPISPRIMLLNGILIIEDRT